LLSKKNIQVTVLEASSRLGGRIQTIKGSLDTPLELGATWFSDMHQNLISLMDRLGLKKYPQFSKGTSLFQTKSFEPPQKFFVPEAENPSYRIAGGTQTLIDSLVNSIPSENIKLNTGVVSIKEIENEIAVETIHGECFHADKVILCLPPQLIHSKIKFSPLLPENIIQILPTVQTWMAGAIKFVLEFEKPFWREKGYSGMLYSHAGIVVEMYDHTNVEENKFGFTGFLNGGASSYSDEYVLSGNQIIQRPHQNNGHPLLQKSYMNDKLHFAGTESATEFSGYMEGAIISALKIADIFK
jgi:monoamine oxidase